MGRLFRLLAVTLSFLLLAWPAAHGQAPLRPVNLHAQRVIAVSKTRLHVQEATGRNDGPEVELAQRIAGAKKLDPWCGCERNLWNYYCGYASPRWPAAARNWSIYSDPRTFYVRGRRGSLDSIRVGDTVTCYYTNLGRVGHVGMVVAIVYAKRPGLVVKGFLVRAGNTGRGGGRDGAGVYDVYYSAIDIYAAARW